MAAKFPDNWKTKSLDIQILAAERQLAQRQRRVADIGSRCFKHLRQRMSAPATLLLASGIGFMTGELTNRQAFATSSNNQEPCVADAAAMSITLNFLTLIHKIHEALPLILIIKSYFESSSLNGTPESGNETPTKSFVTGQLKQIDTPVT